MTTIDNLLTELQRHKVRFVPTNNKQRYLKHLWDYYSRYCELKELGELSKLTNVIKCAMRVHIKMDIANARNHYKHHNTLYKIWIPDERCITDYVRQQITLEGNTL